MSDIDSCPTKTLTVIVQGNGIIRLTTGLLIARLCKDITFESLKEVKK